MKSNLHGTLGARLRERRLELQIKQADAAHWAGVTTEFYARIERGKALPSVPSFVKLAKGLGVAPSYLLGETDITYPVIPGVTGDMRRIITLARKAEPRTLKLILTLLQALEKKHQSK